MKPENNPLSTYGLIAGVLGQVGCLIVLIVLGSLLGGFLLDNIFGTKPLFVFILLLVSVPLTIWMIFVYTRYKAKAIEGSTNQKEEDISE